MPDNFIQADKIKNILEKTVDVPVGDVESIVRKALSLDGLDLEETAILLNLKDEELAAEIYRAAREVKDAVYGKRLVLFAPLYLSNSCVNNCLYCGFRTGNRNMKRKVLTTDEIKAETEVLIREGHKRVLVVAAENPAQCGMEYLKRAIDTVYSTKINYDNIRRINVNVAPLTKEDFKRLKSMGIGTYQLFQETYHKETYEYMHPQGPKGDYLNRLYALHRAMEGGIDDVGMGVLFGLHDYRFEVLSLICHARQLEKEFGVGPHTISVPRIEPAQNAPLSDSPPERVSDESFKRLVSVLRLAVPYTGMILSTRENPVLRDEVIHLGISQISASSRTYPGGYTDESGMDRERGQFSLGDIRTMKELIRDISGYGFTPSFCTACYRTGRTGKKFMDHAKPGKIHKFCHPNAILTFKEYLLDFAQEELKLSGDTLIENEVSLITDINIKEATIRKLKEMESGRRDIYF